MAEGLIEKELRPRLNSLWFKWPFSSAAGSEA